MTDQAIYAGPMDVPDVGTPARGRLPVLGLLVRIAIGVLIFWIIARSIDISGAARVLSGLDVGLFAVATGLIVFQHIFAAARWMSVCRTQGEPIPFRVALAGYVEANFFNQALPSTIGGDAYRVLRARQAGQNFGVSVVAVFVDRALGLLTLTLMAVVGAYYLSQIPSAALTANVLAAVIAVVVGGAIVGALLSTVLPALRRITITRPLYWLSDGVARVFKSPVATVETLGHSLIGHSITAVAFLVLARSLGLSFDLVLAFVALPAILLAAAVPISFSGWGVRESASVVILGHLGMPAESALALSVLLGLSLVAVGLVGGLVWLAESVMRQDETATDEARPASAALAAAGGPGPLDEEPEPDVSASLTPRKREILAHAELVADSRDAWITKNRSYFADDRGTMRFLVNEGARVLDLGCGTGDLLARLNPSYGLGLDFSPRMIRIARRNHRGLEFRVGDVEDPATMAGIDGTFDYIVMSDTIGLLDDLETALNQLHRFCGPETRLVISYYSHFWEPLIYVAEKLGFRRGQPQANFITDTDFANLLHLADFEPVRSEMRQLVPMRLLGLGTLINRYIGTLPLIRNLCLRRYIVARSLRAQTPRDMSVSVLVPCRNERGNIEPIVQRMPRFGSRQEIVFIEGNSRDGTYEECLRIKEKYAGEWDIQVLKQSGKGKGDAMRKGYDAAKHDILMILDADMTVPPEALPRFYRAIASGKGEFINGSRLVYPMEKEAMRPLNLIANRIFAWLFTYLLNQRFTDTLCGTKVVTRAGYDRIAANRNYFGEFDPFGDFDLIFGASKQSLRIVEVPVHYKARVYGETQISRFRDGFLLLRMVVFAWRKLKAI
ncbi:lysylphosphatidylglycerol synthase domain-containing protein [Rhodoplanes azumiensis]|uniref:Lysylphosphatidylglycerol synthase domain-containing protein n=1 Tax=Rhodoplanes azumiensis TaxID=1897628 RepID=A0ABW5AJY2_9BRAD